MSNDEDPLPSATDTDAQSEGAVRAAPPSEQRDALVRDAIQAAYQAVKAGDAPGARKLSGAMLEFAPDLPQVWAVRGRVLRAIGDLDAADQAESRAIAMVADRIAQAPVPLGLQQRMNLFAQVTFLGGPAESFVELGQMQLIAMLEEGLECQHRVLDIGCGALRAGVWLMKVLEPGHYCGIEPHRTRLRFGLEHVVGEDLQARKQPRLDHNARFDLSVFGERFHFMVARSVWTHSSKPQILTMLDGFLANSTQDAVFLTSYLPARLPEQDYLGEDWVGRSERSPFGGLVGHAPAWIKAACDERGLAVRELPRHVVNQQIWLRIERA